jgi:hypothetical protein
LKRTKHKNILKRSEETRSPGKRNKNIFKKKGKRKLKIRKIMTTNKE